MSPALKSVICSWESKYSSSCCKAEEAPSPSQQGALLSHTLLGKQKCFWPLDRQPYLLSLSLKRLEIVGDILQLFFQLGTFTVGFCKERGEKRKRSGKERQERQEVNSCAGKTRKFFRRQSAIRLDGTLPGGTCAGSKFPSCLQVHTLSILPAHAQGTELS